MRNMVRAIRGLPAAAFAISFMAALAIGPAFANPGDNGGGDSGGGSAGGSMGSSGASQGGNGGGDNTGLNKLKCRNGFVVDTRKHICVRAETGIVPDQDLISYALVMNEAERFQEALDTLALLENPYTAVALNYRGYATRKLGRVDEGIGYYLESVAIDPAYPQVREYLGEAYVAQGKLDLANEQLTAIASLCGTTCDSYTDLAEAIAGAE